MERGVTGFGTVYVGEVGWVCPVGAVAGEDGFFGVDAAAEGEGRSDVGEGVDVHGYGADALVLERVWGVSCGLGN